MRQKRFERRAPAAAPTSVHGAPQRIPLPRPAPVEWNFANWDLVGWLQQMAPAMGAETAGSIGLMSHQFGGYNDYKVFRYTGL